MGLDGEFATAAPMPDFGESPGSTCAKPVCTTSPVMAAARTKQRVWMVKTTFAFLITSGSFL